MSFLTMDDRDYIDGLIGVYELNNVALLRDAYIDAYTGVRAKLQERCALKSIRPDKAALAYRDFVREAVRRCVLEWKEFRPRRRDGHGGVEARHPRSGPLAGDRLRRAGSSAACTKATSYATGCARRIL